MVTGSITTETKRDNQVGRKLDTGKAPLLRGLLAYFRQEARAPTKQTPC
jgi:hypothetical protein